MRRIKRRAAVTAAVFAALAALLVVTALFDAESYAFASFIFIILILLPFYFSFESRRPQARELVPIAILAAVAALGRVAFAPFPYVKPTTAVVIISGIAFGPEAGFVTGATAALCSNIFFGQGPFTPWQMFAWGIVGFLAGVFSKFTLRGRLSICVFGFISAFLYGWIMDLWNVLGLVRPISAGAVFLAFAASAYFDLIHAVTTAVFLLLLAKPWLKALTRVKLKYGLMK